MHWIWYILIAYGFCWITLIVSLSLKIFFDMRPFSEKIEPIPKHYYLINTQDKKGVYKFIRKDKEYYIFEFYKPPYEDGLQPINKRDIIREATKEELKEILIDEL